MPTKEQILQILGRINDPELKRPLTELKMVRSVTIEHGNIQIAVALTVPGCPLRDRIESDIKNSISALDGVSAVDVAFDVLSEKELADLKLLLSHGQIASSAQQRALPAKQTIAVASGKGGVGKSTLTVNLAAALTRLGYRAGIVDADVFGYSIPRMLALEGYAETSSDKKIIPLRYNDHLQVVSMGFFVGDEESVTWRGPQLHKAVTEFLFETSWDRLDYLFIDLPPGTGDIVLTMAQAVPLASVVLVTTPQLAATDVAVRVAKLALKADLRLLGIIENMAYYERDGVKDYIFGRDGGEQLANELGVRLLGQIPLLSALRKGCDAGKPIALHGTHDEIAIFERIARQLEKVAPI